MRTLHVLYTSEVSLPLLRPILDTICWPEKTAQIAIKPNLVLAKPSESGATTDPALVEAIIIYLQQKGYRRIKVIESSWVGDSTKRAYRVCGYEELCRKLGIPLVDLKQDKTVRQRIEDIELEICQEALAADFLINVPVLKAHCQTRLTCALKNLKGCIPDREKRRFHTMGLHRPIAALNRVIRSHLTIVDGIVGDLTFEEGGNPVQMNRIIVGQDPVLVDAYAASLLGYDFKEIPYLHLAAEMGIGSADIDKARIVEHNQAQCQKAVLPKSGRLVRRLAGHIEARQACSACYGSLMQALARFEQKRGRLPSDLKVAIGQAFRGDKPDEQVTLGVGNCTAGIPQHVPGCPPTARDVLKKMESLLS